MRELTAEEVAEEVWLNIARYHDKGCQAKIAQGLTAYAEERVKEAKGKCTLEHQEMEIIRNEALEEAAKIAEMESDKCDDNDNAELRVWALAEKIRAIKGE